MANDDLQVEDRPEEQRFEGILDGARIGVIEYRRTEDGIVAEHTEVDDEYEGEGMASQLVAGMTEILRTDGRRLQVECSYIRSWLERHPEATDVVEPPA